MFACLSHDVVAHETTHGLLDGLHRRFREPNNPDVLAFHEAFADIVAMFQHFTLPDALRDQIARTQGDLGRQNLLGELGQQFGQAIGQRGALRSAIGGVDYRGQWQPAHPSPDNYLGQRESGEPHGLGAVLVAAVFDAFLSVYRARSADLIRLATGGTGVLKAGAIPYELVNRLAQEASKTAAHVLTICIRALDYAPPVDLTFGDYLRALVTADQDLVPDDRWAYRVAFIEAFRRQGIYPEGVRSLSEESLTWEPPEVELPGLRALLGSLALRWDQHQDRRQAYEDSKKNAIQVHDWFRKAGVREEEALALGFSLREDKEQEVNGERGRLSKFEVHSVRPTRRIGPDGQQQSDVVVEITQSWKPDGFDGPKYRGGCTCSSTRKRHKSGTAFASASAAGRGFKPSVRCRMRSRKPRCGASITRTHCPDRSHLPPCTGEYERREPWQPEKQTGSPPLPAERKCGCTVRDWATASCSPCRVAGHRFLSWWIAG